MTNEEALSKINDIHRVIASSNRALFSGRRMMVYGCMITLIPVLELATRGITVGSELINSIVHAGIYIAIFKLVGRFMDLKRLVNPESLPPAIARAFSLRQPILVAIMGIAVALVASRQEQLIFPFTLVLLGLIYSLYGRFSIWAVNVVAWSYIALGIVTLYFSRAPLPYLWAYLTVYMGVSYAVMGFLLSREQEEVA